MNGLRFAVVVSVALLFAGISRGDEPMTNEVIRVKLDLLDGSRVVGIPAMSSVGIQTPFAKLDIPMKKVRLVTLGADHEAVSVKLANGDELSGTATMEPVVLSTLFGQVKIGLEHIGRMQVSVTGGAGALAGLRESLLVHLSFDDDTNGQVSDLSGNRNDGLVQGATRVEEGRKGGAYRCGSTSGYIDLGSKESLKLIRTDFTIMSWIKVDAFGHMNSGIVGSAPWASPGRGYFLTVFGKENGTPGLLQGGFYTGRNSQSYVRSTAKVVDAGGWYHVAWVWSAKTGHALYVNGQPIRDVESSGGGATMADYTPAVWVGVEWREQGSYNRGLNGQIDDFMIFNRALSAPDIEQIYSEQK